MQFRRRKKLIRPGLQLRLVGTFLGIALLGVLLQFLLTSRGLIEAAASIPGAGGVLADHVPGVALRSLLATVLVVIPLLSLVGIYKTFRLAGPVYRFEVFLNDVKAGRQIEPCRLRKGDEFMELCALINDVTEQARRDAAANAEPDGDATADEAQAA